MLFSRCRLLTRALAPRHLGLRTCAQAGFYNGLALVGRGFCRGAAGSRLNSAISSKNRGLFECARDCSHHAGCRGIAHRQPPAPPRCVLYFVTVPSAPALPSGYQAGKAGPAAVITETTGKSHGMTRDHACFAMSTQR